jgi:hypothetical protein
MGLHKRRNNKRLRIAANIAKGVPNTGKTREISTRHAQNRARLRYGQRLTDKDMRVMNDMIRDRLGRYIGKQSASRSLWLLKYNGVMYAAVYNKNLNCIVTFMPEHVRDEWVRSTRQKVC